LDERLGLVRWRNEQACLDKFDGKVSEELWFRKSAEWQEEEQQVMLAIQGLERASPDRILDSARI